MKATDLRIDNLVKFNDRVITVSTTTLDRLLYPNLSRHKVHLNAYAPIVLTEEILANACGFQESGDYWFKEHVYIWKWGILNVTYHTKRITDERGDRQINYLHELQNIYHSLTGEELVVNL